MRVYIYIQGVDDLPNHRKLTCKTTFMQIPVFLIILAHPKSVGPPRKFAS